MKSFKSIIAIVLTGWLFSCEPQVTFTEPQPSNTAILKKFPGRVQGNYVSLADSSVLNISSNIIQRIYDLDYKINVNELDSNFIIEGDTIIDKISGERTPFTKTNDSLMVHVHSIDTLFLIGEENVLKKSKGYYFLNTNYDRNSWEVKKMHLHKGKLSISSISTELELDNLRAITESPIDTVPPYIFTPTKKQFKKFVRQEGFSNEEVFIKQ